MKKVIFTIELVCEDSELRSCKLFSQLALHPGCIRVSSEDFKPLEKQEYYQDSGPGYPVLYGEGCLCGIKGSRNIFGWN